MVNFYKKSNFFNALERFAYIMDKPLVLLVGACDSTTNSFFATVRQILILEAMHMTIEPFKLKSHVQVLDGNKTLLQMSRPFVSDTEYKEQGYLLDEMKIIINGFKQLAQIDPVNTIQMACLLDRSLSTWELMQDVVVPCVQNIPDSDLNTLRLATAYIVGNAQGIFSENGYGADGDAPTIHAMAYLFKTLSRMPGQKEEVRELADNFAKAFVWEEDGRPAVERNTIDLIAPILPFTTMGSLAVAQSRSARRAPKKVA